MHWVGAISILCMMLSGWAIYNASPSLPFTFPRWMTRHLMMNDWADPAHERKSFSLRPICLSPKSR
jgi:thiosulfate reductase cytochrome b subunit